MCRNELNKNVTRENKLQPPSPCSQSTTNKNLCHKMCWIKIKTWELLQLGWKLEHAIKNICFLHSSLHLPGPADVRQRRPCVILFGVKITRRWCHYRLETQDLRPSFLLHANKILTFYYETCSGLAKSWSNKILSLNYRS